MDGSYASVHRPFPLVLGRPFRQATALWANRTIKQRSLASSSVLVLGGKLAANIGYFVGVSIVARSLGPSGRGTVAFVTVTALLVASIASLGVGAAAKVFIPQRPEVRGRIYTNGVLFVVGLERDLRCARGRAS